MPTTIESNHPDYKTLLYQLVNFLIKIKLKKEGKGINRPISVPLSDFKPLLSYATGGSDYNVKVEELKNELLGLTEETNENEKSIFKIGNPEVFDDLGSNIEANKKIILVYTRKAMEKYKEDSFEGDIIAQSQNKIIFDKEEHGFIYRNKSIIVRKSGRNVRLNLCLLMYGHQNLGVARHQFTIREFNEKYGRWSGYENYKPGDEVEIDLLKVMLLGLEERSYDPEDYEDRPVTDAIIGINNRAKKVFGKKIFKYTHRTVRVLNP